MSRLHDFITRIRNTKTMAEQRAQYQKQMAVIRQSFAKNQQNMRPRNVTKLLFINMSGQQTNFGQMECLKLITGNTLIQKRIGYLGLTQLFHQKSQLLMMATNRIRVDLCHSNNNLVGLALCVLSQICTPQLANELYKQVLKKAILTSIKLLKKAPQFLNQFFNPILELIDNQRNHGVLLSIFAFLQNAIMIDQTKGQAILPKVSWILRIYQTVVSQNNSQYQISGTQDPFLQVAILRFLRCIRKLPVGNQPSFMKYYGQVLVTSHDSVCAKITGSIKNGANAVLFQCFQCFMTIPPNPTLNDFTRNVLTKFVSVKDSNSKYLSLFNLALMAKHQLQVARKYKDVIIQCLDQNDNLIRGMALDLLYLIAAPQNVSSIIKQLLNVLLNATDQQFIPQLSLKICLIVQKYSQSRRWQFDTILKVLILADKSVNQDSSKSLVYMITSTPQLQKYCLAKLFFSSSSNPHNDTLCKVTMYLLGQLAHVLFQLNQVKITQNNVIDLLQLILFKIGTTDQTIQYGLTCLFKLYDKFSSKQRILKMIKAFQSHSQLQVQKRACQYAKLLDQVWKNQRVKQIVIPVPPYHDPMDSYMNIPIGDTTVDLSNENLSMPQKIVVNYDQHMAKPQQQPDMYHQNKNIQKNQAKSINIVGNLGQNKPVQKSQAPQKSLLDFDDQPIVPVNQPQVKTQQSQNNDPFDFLGLDTPVVNKPVQSQNNNNNMNDLMGFGFNQPQTQSQTQNNNNGLLDGGLIGFGGTSATVTQPQQNNFSFDLLGGSINQPQVQTQQNNGFSFNQPSSPGLGFNQPSSPGLGFNQPSSPGLGFNQPSSPGLGFNQPSSSSSNSHKFKAFSTDHIDIWMQCQKQPDSTTKIIASFHNKTMSFIDQLNLQTAVMKYLKIAIQPLSGTSIAASSKGQVTQLMNVTNSALGQKPIIMKIKLSYNINGQKQNFQSKIEGIPIGF